MYTKKINILNKMLTGTLLIALGVFMLVTGLLTLKATIYIFSLAFIGVGITMIISVILDKLRGKEAAQPLNIAFINLFIGIAMLLTPGLQVNLFAFLCGLYAFLVSAIRGVNFALYSKEKVKGRYIDLVLCLFYFGFGVFLMLSPYIHVDIVIKIIGIFFILYGTMFYKDCVNEWIPIQKKDKLKRSIRITLPAVIDFMIPRFVLKEVNKYLIPSEEKEQIGTADFEQVKIDLKPDIEIIVHMSESGYEVLGHVDICFEDMVISYGNYDYSSIRMFEIIGDGVLMIAQREEYIPFVIKHSKKTLFSFGLHLEDNQIKEVAKKLDELQSELVDWVPPDFTGGDDMYPTLLRQKVPASFYKFKHGKFKNYFVVGTNCVLLVDQILGSAGIDALKMSGIITPGTYYDFLNREFASKRTLVVSKTIYN